MGQWLEEKSNSFSWDDPEPPVCSECGKPAIAFRKTPFCPWCGEPMELEKEEE